MHYLQGMQIVTACKKTRRITFEEALGGTAQQFFSVSGASIGVSKLQLKCLSQRLTCLHRVWESSTGMAMTSPGPPPRPCAPLQRLLRWEHRAPAGSPASLRARCPPRRGPSRRPAAGSAGGHPPFSQRGWGDPTQGLGSAPAAG